MCIFAQQLISITNYIRIIPIEIHTLIFKDDYLWHLQTVKNYKIRMIAYKKINVIQLKFQLLCVASTDSSTSRD